MNTISPVNTPIAEMPPIGERMDRASDEDSKKVDLRIQALRQDKSATLSPPSSPVMSKMRLQKMPMTTKKTLEGLERFLSSSEKQSKVLEQADLQLIKAKYGEIQNKIGVDASDELGQALSWINREQKKFDGMEKLVQSCEDTLSFGMAYFDALDEYLTLLWNGKPPINLYVTSMQPPYQFGLKHRMDQIEQGMGAEDKKAKSPRSTPPISEDSSEGSIEQAVPPLSSFPTPFDSWIDSLCSLVVIKEDLTILEYAITYSIIKHPDLIAALTKRLEQRYQKTFFELSRQNWDSELSKVKGAHQDKAKQIIAQIKWRLQEAERLFQTLRILLNAPYDPDLDELNESSAAPFKIEQGLQQLEQERNIEEPLKDIEDYFHKIVRMKERLWAQKTLEIDIADGDQAHIATLKNHFSKYQLETNTLKQTLRDQIKEDRERIKQLKDPHQKILEVWKGIFEKINPNPSPVPASSSSSWFSFLYK